MATNILETDSYIETADPTGTLFTDLWAFEPVVVVLTANLQTNIWTFSPTGVPGEMPVYNPSIVSAMKKVSQNMPFPQFVIGGQGGLNEDEYALFKKSDDQIFTIWRSQVYQIGKDFDIKSILFNLVNDIEIRTSITVKLYFDNERESAVAKTINANNYSNDNKLIELTPKNFDRAISGKHNFFMEFQFRGSALAPISLPIFIDLNVYE